MRAPCAHKRKSEADQWRCLMRSTSRFARELRGEKDRAGERDTLLETIQAQADIIRLQRETLEANVQVIAALTTALDAHRIKVRKR